MLLFRKRCVNTQNFRKHEQETNSLRRINDSYRKIVVVRHQIVPWYDEDGIYYIGLEDFCLSYIDELDSTL